jgi:hypothetical protein
MCYVSHLLEIKAGWKYFAPNVAAIRLSLLVHVLLDEKPAVNFCLSDEYFSVSKPTPGVVGILSDSMASPFKTFIHWCHGSEEEKRRKANCGRLRYQWRRLTVLWWVGFVWQYG